MIIEKNGVEIPDYLNPEFFKTALQNGLKLKNVEILSLEYSMGSGGGENYCSLIYRVVITYTTSQINSQNISVIVKSLPTDGERILVEEMQLYEKETEVYFDLIPKIESIFNDQTFAPKCLYFVSKPIKTIVFEDLNVKGFRMADREKGLDEAHCALVLKKLGQFHAASMIIAEKSPQLMNGMQGSLFNKDSFERKIMQALFGGNIQTTAKVIETWPGYESIAIKLRNLQKTFLKKVGEVVEPTPNELKVLNHGDLWVNNFLFKYDKSVPIDISFIDFQGSVYTSPGIDINYFFYTSIQIDVLETRRDFILKNYYYKTLKTVLENARYKPIPTFDDIVNEIEKKELFGCFAAVGILALICMDKESSKDNSLDNIVDEEVAEKKRMIACSTKRFQGVMRYILKRLDKKGMLDSN